MLGSVPGIRRETASMHSFIGEAAGFTLQLLEEPVAMRGRRIREPDDYLPTISLNVVSIPKLLAVM